jgi:hypothetical protein
VKGIQTGLVRLSTSCRLCNNNFLIESLTLGGSGLTERLLDVLVHFEAYGLEFVCNNFIFHSQFVNLPILFELSRWFSLAVRFKSDSTTVKLMTLYVEQVRFLVVNRL